MKTPNTHSTHREINLDPDFARSLLLKPDELAREISAASAGVETRRAQNNVVDYHPGISIIIPAYQARETLPRTLESIARQDIESGMIEVVLVVNGPDDGSLELAHQHARRHAHVELKIYHHEVASAGYARNIGLSLATREFVTFVDADDELEESFLSSALLHADNDRIVLNPIINVDAEGTLDADNALNVRIRDLAGSSFPLTTHPWVLSFNACKTFPTPVARTVAYDPELRSGEDIVYFAQLLSQHEQLKVVVVEQGRSAAYLRHVTDESISRQPESYDFNVVQRIAVLAALAKIETDSRVVLETIGKLQQAQAGFVLRFLEKNPDRVDDVELELAQQSFFQFPWELYNREKARDLVISYCFAPASDTSANVAAKVVAERGKIVDVISNDMSAIRRMDPENLGAVRRWISSHTIVQAPPSFAGWEANCQFANLAVNEAEQQHVSNGGYKTLYSRALWIGSHLAAAMFIDRHPEVKWTAEFSDPLRYDANGSARPGQLVKNRISDRLKRTLASAGFDDFDIETPFDLVEASTFLLADELIFTNKNQLEFMLDDYSDTMKELVRSKATVRHHPQPPAAAYMISKSDYKMPRGVVNIGFFGSFYENRGMTEVFVALANLPIEARRRLRLHIFCNRPKETLELAHQLGVTANVYVNPYLGYFSFLNLTTKFDVLLVNDVVRGAALRINPFLPSKYSDYLGSGAKIWGLVDDGSPLSQLPIDFTSKAGNGADIRKTLLDIAQLEPSR